MPSWLYSVKNGATTIWERWNSYSKEDSFADNSMTSFNHYSYGAVAEWMYKYMSGITMDEQKPGFKEIILQPTLDENQNISFVNGSYNSYYGNIESNWTANESGQLQTYQAIVPANTSATLYLPISEEIAKTYQQISGVTFVQMTEHNGCTVACLLYTSSSCLFLCSYSPTIWSINAKTSCFLNPPNGVVLNLSK